MATSSSVAARPAGSGDRWGNGARLAPDQGISLTRPASNQCPALPSALGPRCQFSGLPGRFTTVGPCRRDRKEAKKKGLTREGEPLHVGVMSSLEAPEEGLEPPTR